MQHLIILLFFGIAGSASADGRRSVQLDLLVDGEPKRCLSVGEVTLHPSSGALTAQCEDGQVVHCLVAPWNWALEAEPLRLTAMCEAVTGGGFEVLVTPTSQNVQVGDAAQWQVRVKNTGPGPLSSVQISTTPATAGCNRNFANLNAGAQISYGCALYNVSGNTTVNFSGMALRSGSPVNAAANAQIVTGSGGTLSEGLELFGCANEISAVGGTTTWRVNIKNNGTYDWHNVIVTDTQASNCARALGTIASGARVIFECSSNAPAPHTGLIRATGTHTMLPNPTVQPSVVLAIVRRREDELFANGFQ